MSESRVAALVHPGLGTIHGGNETTARRWATILASLGWRVHRMERWDEAPCDLLIALHALHGHDSVMGVLGRRPEVPVIVGAAGTDLMEAGDGTSRAMESFAHAWRIVVLQPNALEALPEELRSRARVIYQSAQAPEPAPARDEAHIVVCHPANVRRVKDPLCAVRAAGRLPRDSRVLVRHLGGAIELDLMTEWTRLGETTERFESLGPLPPDRALQEIARAHAVLSTSTHEGGANALTEALACGVPILATRIPGSVGLLGDDYPGYFPVGDDRALAALLLELERGSGFRGELEEACRDRAWIAAPAQERRRWRELLAELPPRGDPVREDLRSP